MKRLINTIKNLPFRQQTVELNNYLKQLSLEIKYIQKLFEQLNKNNTNNSIISSFNVISC
jgi:hypothetical protein